MGEEGKDEEGGGELKMMVPLRGGSITYYHSESFHLDV